MKKSDRRMPNDIQEDNNWDETGYRAQANEACKELETKLEPTYGNAGDKDKAYGDAWDS